MSENPTSQGGRLLKRGDSRDPEDWRTSHRLMVAQSILRGLGFEPTWPEHSEACIKHPSRAFQRCFGYNYYCDDPACPRRNNPAPSWPEGCSGEVFDKAYELADAVQEQRGHLTAQALNRYARAPRDELQLEQEMESQAHQSLDDDFQEWLVSRGVDSTTLTHREQAALATEWASLR